MKIRVDEVGMYGLSISTEEAFWDVARNDGKKLDEVIRATEKKPAVYQDPQGRYQMLLYRTPAERKIAYKAAHKAGLETAAYVLNRIYVKAKNMEGSV